MGIERRVCVLFGILQLLKSGFFTRQRASAAFVDSLGRCFLFFVFFCGKLPLSSRDGWLLHAPSLDSLTPDAVGREIPSFGNMGEVEDIVAVGKRGSEVLVPGPLSIDPVLCHQFPESNSRRR